MDLFLVRHPKPEVERGICYGQSDLPLADPKALPEQAQRLAGQLPSRYALFCSPLQRALALAQQLGQPIVDPRLQEMNFGAWEMRAFASVDPHCIDAWAQDPLGYRMPGGECGHAVRERVLAFARARIVGASQDCVVVGHQGPFRLWVAQLLGIEATQSHRLHFEYARLCHLRIQPGLGVQLLGLNQ